MVALLPLSSLEDWGLEDLPRISGAGEDCQVAVVCEKVGDALGCLALEKLQVLGGQGTNFTLEALRLFIGTL